MEPWTLENTVPSGDIGTFLTYSSLWVQQKGESNAGGQKQLRRVWGQCHRRAHGKKMDFSFYGGSFWLSDIPRSVRPLGFDEDCLNTLIYNERRQCTQEQVNVMNCNHSTIVRHLHSMGKVQESGVWVPHALSQNHTNQRVAICASLFARHWLIREQHRLFLSCIVTGDEKWCLYANVMKRKKWLSPKKGNICRKCSSFSTWYSKF